MRITCLDVFTYLFLACVLAAMIGCGTDPSGQVVQSHEQTIREATDTVTPPQFNLGDVVIVQGSVKAGIITSATRQQIDSEWCWVYTVMFQNNSIYYSESNLELLKAFDWQQAVKPGVND